MSKMKLPQDLMIRFLTIAPDTRQKIGRKLGLIYDEEFGRLPMLEIDELILTRAGARGRGADLRLEVEAAEKQGRIMTVIPLDDDVVCDYHGRR